jgi:hypothetical protein
LERFSLSSNRRASKGQPAIRQIDYCKTAALSESRQGRPAGKNAPQPAICITQTAEIDGQAATRAAAGLL